MRHRVTRSTTLSTEFKASKISEHLERGGRVRVRGVLYEDGDVVRERALPDTFGRDGRPVREPRRDPAVPLATLHGLCASLDDEAFHRVTHGWWRT